MPASFEHYIALASVSDTIALTDPPPSPANTDPDGKSRNGTGVFEYSYDAKIAGYIHVA